MPFSSLFKNVSFYQPYEIVHFRKETKFFRTIGPKKNGLPTQFTTKITVYWPKIFFKIFEKIGQNYDVFHPFSTTTQQGIENRGVAVMSRIAPIILKLYRYASILSSGYILVQEFDSSTLTSFPHP